MVLFFQRHFWGSPYSLIRSMLHHQTIIPNWLWMFERLQKKKQKNNTARVIKMIPRVCLGVTEQVIKSRLSVQPQLTWQALRWGGLSSAGGSSVRRCRLLSPCLSFSHQQRKCHFDCCLVCWCLPVLLEISKLQLVTQKQSREEQCCDAAPLLAEKTNMLAL